MAEAAVNSLGFHEIVGENVQVTKDTATWFPVANGSFAFCKQSLDVGMPVTLEMAGSGQIILGFITEDPKKFANRTLSKVQDIPEFILINEVKVHKRTCSIVANLEPGEEGVVTKYNDKKYKKNIRSGTKIWLTVYIKFGDITVTLNSEASPNNYPLFSEVIGMNLQYVGGKNKIKTNYHNPAAICFAKVPLKSHEIMNLMCEPVSNGSADAERLRFHLKIYITDTDPGELYRLEKHMFSVTAIKTSEMSWISSVTMEKKDSYGKVSIERTSNSIVFTNATNKKSTKHIYIHQNTDLWVALELYGVSVRQVEVEAVSMDTVDGGYLQQSQSSSSLKDQSESKYLEEQQHQNLTRSMSSYVVVTGNKNDTQEDVAAIEQNVSLQQKPSAPREEQVQFQPSYNSHFAKLVKDLFAMPLCDWLLSLDVITKSDYDTVRSKETHDDQNRELLFLLCKRPVSKAHIIKALTESGNKHLIPMFCPD